MSAASTLQLDLKPSLKLAGLLLVAHAVALAAVWVSLAGWPRVLVGFGILLSGTGCLAATEDKVVAGMKGYGVTDMGDGRGIQRFDVEILGLLRKFAPGLDLRGLV